MQRRSCLSLDPAQFGQALVYTSVMGGRLGSNARGFGDDLLDVAHGRLSLSQIVPCLLPAAIEQSSLSLAQTPAQGAVARGLASLALERLHLRF